MPQYTQVSRRLACAMPISPGSTSHTGTHKHGEDDNLFHFCEERCGQCEYFCTLPIGEYNALATQPVTEIKAQVIRKTFTTPVMDQ